MLKLQLSQERRVGLGITTEKLPMVGGIGVKVVRTYWGLPGQLHGVKEGDTILSIDGHLVRSGRQATKLLDQASNCAHLVLADNSMTHKKDSGSQMFFRA